MQNKKWAWSAVLLLLACSCTQVNPSILDLPGRYESNRGEVAYLHVPTADSFGIASGWFVVQHLVENGQIQFDSLAYRYYRTVGRHVPNFEAYLDLLPFTYRSDTTQYTAYWVYFNGFPPKVLLKPARPWTRNSSRTFTRVGSIP